MNVVCLFYLTDGTGFMVGRSLIEDDPPFSVEEIEEDTINNIDVFINELPIIRNNIVGISCHICDYEGELLRAFFVSSDGTFQDKDVSIVDYDEESFFRTFNWVNVNALN
jgi:hypothetical protein